MTRRSVYRERTWLSRIRSSFRYRDGGQSTPSNYRMSADLRAYFPEGRSGVPQARAPFPVTHLRARRPVARRRWGGSDGDTRPDESQLRRR
jgi:hypothetical protein